MTKNDKNIDKISARRIKNLGLDEPSADFTLKVMQAIALEAQPAYLVQRKNYWWLLPLAPVIVAISWYLIVLFQFTGYVYHFWASARSVIQSFIAGFISLFTEFKNLTISPLLLVGFVAILSLLTIEELVGRMKHTS